MTSGNIPPVVSLASSEPDLASDSRGDAVRGREVELGAADAPQRRREKLARIILDQMYQFVALLDPEGTVLEVNRAALEGAALKLEDIQGEPFWSVRWWTVSQEAQLQLQDAIRQAAQGEFVRYDVEVYGQAAGEETIIIDFSLNPVMDEHGSVVFLLAEGRNITEKKHAEAEIAHKNEQLRTLLQQVRELDEVALLLELEGYPVAAVNDGLEALDWLDGGEEPALVLLDLMMPNLDGWGFLERWQSRAAAARCPVVVLSGADVRGSVGGAHCVLRKPVRTEELLQLVKRLAREPGLART